MPRKDRPQYERLVVSDLRAVGLDPQSVSPRDGSVFRLIAWSPSEDNRRLAFEERDDGTFVVALDQRVGGPGKPAMKPLGYTVLRSYEQARTLARDLATAMVQGRASAMRARQGRDDYRVALPNPTRGPRYTTRDAARILRDLGLHPRAYGAKELAVGMNVEREHHSVTHGDEVMTARIALDHLRERADYYRVLAKAEKAPRMNPTKREQQLIRQIQSVLTPDLLKPKYRAGNDASNPMYGHCYAASDALYHMLGGKAAGYTPMVATDDTGGTHWWLRGPKGEIIDVTAAQYTSVGKKPPYNAPDARGCGFSSRKDASGIVGPAKEAREIILRVKEGARENPAGTTPFVLQRAVVAIHEKNPSYSVPRVFAIATASSQRAGYLRAGTRDVTAKGRRVEQGYSAEERAGLERAFEAFAVRGNPATPSAKDRKRADALVERLRAANNPKLHNIENSEVWLFPESDQSFHVTVSFDEYGTKALNFYHSNMHPKGRRYIVRYDAPDVDPEYSIIGDYRTYDEGEEAFLLALNTRLYGRAKALRMRPKGEYRLPLPNPHDAACWVDEPRSNPGDFTTPPTDRAFAAEDHLPKVRERLYAQRGSFGELRGVRLDIPSRMRDLMVVTIHEKPSGGTVVGYDHSAVVKNAEFRVAQGQQAKIMRGEAKAPHAYVSGTLVNEVPTTKGTPISFNPRTTHLFLDATNGRPVKAAKRVSIIGKRVYAEGLVYFAPGEAPKRPV